MIDENSCRFGKWFNTEGKEFIKDDTKTISDLQRYHATVHQKAIHAVNEWFEAKYKAAFEDMIEVEHASDVGFKELYQSFVNHRR